MRKRLFEIMDKSKARDRVSFIYDVISLIAIIVSIFPLMFKEEPELFVILDLITVTFFILDYILRLITADYKLNKGAMSFVLYPTTPFAIIDLFSILPSIGLINPAFKLLRMLRIFKTFRVLKIFRHSKKLAIISKVVKNEKEILWSVFVIALGYIFASALIMFNAESETFNTFFDAIYWATTALTTVGYGDIYPVTVIGRVISMISSLFGVAIIALPSGIITAGFMNELSNERNN